MKKRLANILLVSILISLPLISGATNTSSQKTIVTIYTGSTSGVYYAAGLILCDLINQAKKGVLCRIKSTTGSVFNLKELEKKGERGEVKLAIAQSDMIYMALEGESPFLTAIEQIRNLLLLHEESLVLMTKDPNIVSLKDIAGKKIYIGESGSGTWRTVQDLLKTCNISIQDSNDKFEDVASLMQQGNRKAAFTFVGHPAKTIANFINQTGAKFIPLADESCVKEFIRKNPFLVKAIIPGGLYTGINNDTITIGTKAALVSTKNLPDYIAAMIVEAAIKKNDLLRGYHPALERLTKEYIVGQGVARIHPSVVDYIQNGMIAPATKSSTYEAKEVMTVIQEEGLRIEDLLRYWQSTLTAGKNPEGEWKIIRGQLDVSRQWIFQECSSEKMCQDFSYQVENFLERGISNIGEVRETMRLFLETLSLKATQKQQEEREKSQTEKYNQQQKIMWLGITLSIALIIVIASLTTIFFRRGRLIERLENSNTALGQSEQKEKVFRELHEVMSRLLQLSLQSEMPPEQIIAHMLNIILCIPFVNGNQGCIFIADQETGKFVLTAQKGMSTECITKCSQVEMNHCLCGQAATKKDVLFIEEDDKIAEIFCNNGSGQFFVPLFDHGETIGVAILQKREKWGEIKEEKKFLNDAVSVTASSVLEKIKEAEKNKRLALRDSLTKIANRNALLDFLEQEIKRAIRNNEKVLFAYFDANLFKFVNDKFGHKAGDKFLQEIARRLETCIRTTDFVARLGGDALSMILPLTHLEYIAKIMEKLAKALSEPVIIDGRQAFISLSMGFAIYPDDADGIENLMRYGDTAMYESKRAWQSAGSNIHTALTWRPFSKEMRRKQIEEQEMITNLEAAIATMHGPECQFFLVCQPVIGDDGKIVSFEALIRWDCPGKGVMRPDLWIPLTEETCLILSIGRWAVREACIILKRLRESGFPGIGMSVNFSGVQFERDTIENGIIEYTAQQMDEHDIEKGGLKVELTESREMTNVVENKLQTLARITSIWLDDFGTGFAAASTLRKKTPSGERLLGGMKVDQGFVRALPDKDELAYVTALASLGIALGIDVIFEGVETIEQLKMLLRIKGKKLFQGYFFDMPLLPQKAEEVLIAQKAWIKDGKDPMDFWIEKKEREIEQKNKNS